MQCPLGLSMIDDEYDGEVMGLYDAVAGHRGRPKPPHAKEV